MVKIFAWIIQNGNTIHHPSWRYSNTFCMCMCLRPSFIRTAKSFIWKRSIFIQRQLIRHCELSCKLKTLTRSLKCLFPCQPCDVITEASGAYIHNSQRRSSCKSWGEFRIEHIHACGRSSRCFTMRRHGLFFRFSLSWSLNQFNFASPMFVRIHIYFFHRINTNLR